MEDKDFLLYQFNKILDRFAEEELIDVEIEKLTIEISFIVLAVVGYFVKFTP